MHDLNKNSISKSAPAKMKILVVGIGVIFSLAFFVGSKTAISVEPTSKTDENLGL